MILRNTFLVMHYKFSLSAAAESDPGNAYPIRKRWSITFHICGFAVTRVLWFWKILPYCDTRSPICKTHLQLIFLQSCNPLSEHTTKFANLNSLCRKHSILFSMLWCCNRRNLLGTHRVQAKCYSVTNCSVMHLHT